jgi:beta-phosphoglucomutase
MMKKENNIEYLYNKINKCSVLFFDLDGTLVDTNVTNFCAYKKAIKLVMNIEKEIIFNDKARFCRSSLKKHFPNINEREYNQIILEKERLFFEFLSKSIINTFVKNILIKYSNLKTIALVTNCRKNRALETLLYHGILEKFNNIICRQNNNDSETTNKYQDAISQLNVLPSSIIVFENEMNEINNAILAGIPANNIIIP